MNRVVITGLGAITPLGHDTKETWVNLLAGKSGIDRIKAFDTSKHTVKIAGEIPDFQPEIRVEPKPLKRLDRCVQLSLWATIEAVEDAEIDFTQYDRGRIGVIIGSGIGGLSTWEREFTKFMQGGPARVSPFLIPMMIPDMTAGYVAIHYGCHLLRPEDVTEFKPEIYDALIRVTGASVVEYPLWKQCCGATVLPVNEELAIRLARDKLKSIKEAGAVYITVACPACGNQLDLQQLGMKELYGEEYNLPVLFITQILGLAMGMGDDEVGLEMNRVPAGPILEHLGG